MIRHQLESNSLSGFMRAISILVGGTASAHAITALAMPLLSRLYSPADFGALAVFTGIVTTVGVAACLRYDIAIAIPEKDEDGIALLALALVSAMLIAILSLLTVALAFDHVGAWMDDPGVRTGKWLIPLGIFAAAAWSALQNWHIRKRNYALMAQARMSQSFFTVGAQGAASLAGLGPVGLLAGPPMGFATSGAWFLKRSWSDIARWLRHLRLADLRRIAHKYRRFPAYSTWEALFNQAAIHMPILLIAGATNTAEAGYLMLAMYVLQAPMSLLGSAIGQVYLSRAPEAHREGRLGTFTYEVLGNLIKVGAGPILAVGVLSPVVFPLIFGANWERAGWLVAWMTPWFLLQFLVSPISMVLHVLGAQRMAMALQFFSLVARFGLTWLATLWLQARIAEVYALSGAFIYASYFLVIQICLARVSTRSRPWAFRSCMQNVVPWLLTALLVAFSINRFRDWLGGAIG